MYSVTKGLITYLREMQLKESKPEGNVAPTETAEYIKELQHKKSALTKLVRNERKNCAVQIYYQSQKFLPIRRWFQTRNLGINTCYQESRPTNQGLLGINAYQGSESTKDQGLTKIRACQGPRLTSNQCLPRISAYLVPGPNKDQGLPSIKTCQGSGPTKDQCLTCIRAYLGSRPSKDQELSRIRAYQRLGHRIEPCQVSRPT